jgi:putative acetyltransferase
LIGIREERGSDRSAIREVNTRAFAQAQEANIVEAVRANGAALLSLVATLGGQIAGHIMYSPASVGSITGAALGPMAVLPELQRKGIGGRLVAAGIRTLRERGCPFIVVVGHPDYYPRFGFEPASRYGITCEWDVPDEVFMVLILNSEKMQGVSGLAKFRPEFSNVS